MGTRYKELAQINLIMTWLSKRQMLILSGCGYKACSYNKSALYIRRRYSRRLVLDLSNIATSHPVLMHFNLRRSETS
jgi:hypothetical protein